MTNLHYILDGTGKPVIEPDLMKWGKWFQKNDKARIVAKTRVADCKVSTVFLGLDHNYGDEGPPILWETMVFGGHLDRDQTRCAGSREQAEAMHERMVQAVRESREPKRKGRL